MFDPCSDPCYVDGVAEDELKTWRKGHPYKMNLARRLRPETTVTVAGLLNGCTWGHVRIWLTYFARPGPAGHHQRNPPWGYEEFARIIID